MAGLRATNLPNLGNPTQNEIGIRMNAKQAAAAGMRTTRTRAAMGEIGNHDPNAESRVLRPKDNNIVKPSRMLVKQKATSSLQSAAAVKPTLRRKRKCSEEKEASTFPMEVEGVAPLPLDQDVEMEEVTEVAVPQGFSTANLLAANIEDIDSEDAEDPQLVVDYVHEIYSYLRYLEVAQPIRKEYLKGRVGVILPKMRSVLVDWLVEVHQQFSLLQETLYLAVAILDRYMQEAAEKVSRKKLQLVGVTAMFIAAKYEEMYAPEIGDFVYITDNAYTQSQIRDQEIQIMKVLKFDMGRPLPLHFLRRNSKAGQVDATVHTLAKYVMELTLVDYNFCHVAPSKIAAAALAFATRVLDREGRSLSELWNKTIEYYTQYKLESIQSVLEDLSNLVLNTSRANESAKLMAIRKKYMNKKFGKISGYPELTGDVVIGLAEGQL